MITNIIRKFKKFYFIFGAMRCNKWGESFIKRIGIVESLKVLCFMDIRFLSSLKARTCSVLESWWYSKCISVYGFNPFAAADFSAICAWQTADSLSADVTGGETFYWCKMCRNCRYNGWSLKTFKLYTINSFFELYYIDITWEGLIFQNFVINTWKYNRI